MLKSKLLNMGSPKEVLALTISPPDLRSIEKTVLILKEVCFVVIIIIIFVVAYAFVTSDKSFYHNKGIYFCYYLFISKL